MQEDRPLQSDDLYELGVYFVMGITVPMFGFYAAKNKSSTCMCCFAGCNFVNVITSAGGASQLLCLYPAALRLCSPCRTH